MAEVDFCHIRELEIGCQCERFYLADLVLLSCNLEKVTTLFVGHNTQGILSIIFLQKRHHRPKCQSILIEPVFIDNNLKLFHITTEDIDIGNPRYFEQLVFDLSVCQLSEIFIGASSFGDHRIDDYGWCCLCDLDHLGFTNIQREFGAYLGNGIVDIVDRVVDIFGIFKFRIDHCHFIDGRRSNSPDLIKSIELLFDRYCDIGGDRFG